MSDCCRSGFRWDGIPSGTVTTLEGNDCYVTGDNATRAVLFCHDGFGWTYNNNRLLADHFAREIGATVYLPDFFHGTQVPPDALDKDANGQFKFVMDWPSWIKTNDASVRMPEVLGIAKVLRDRFAKVAAVGYCWGGLIAAKLGAKHHDGLVDCISFAHPSFLTEADIQNIAVPVQILAPEFDPVYTQALKDFSNVTIPQNGIPYCYQYFPGMEHGFATRCDPMEEKQKQALQQAKDAVVYWLASH